MFRLKGAGDRRAAGVLSSWRYSTVTGPMRRCGSELFWSHLRRTAPLAGTCATAAALLAVASRRERCNPGRPCAKRPYLTSVGHPDMLDRLECEVWLFVLPDAGEVRLAVS